MGHGLAVARFALGLAGICVFAWLAGLGAFWALLALGGEPSPFREVRWMAIWSAIGLAVAVPVVYFPALMVLSTHTRDSVAGLILRVSACATCGLVPALLLAGSLGGGSGRAVLLFWPIFAVNGAVLAFGHWLLTRTLEPS